MNMLALSISSSEQAMLHRKNYQAKIAVTFYRHHALKGVAIA